MSARILTAEQVAELLQLPLSTVHQLCRTGELPATKLGRQWRLREEAAHLFDDEIARFGSR